MQPSISLHPPEHNKSKRGSLTRSTNVETSVEVKSHSSSLDAPADPVVMANRMIDRSRRRKRDSISVTAERSKILSKQTSFGIAQLSMGAAGMGLVDPGFCKRIKERQKDYDLQSSIAMALLGLNLGKKYDSDESDDSEVIQKKPVMPKHIFKKRSFHVEVDQTYILKMAAQGNLNEVVRLANEQVDAIETKDFRFQNLIHYASQWSRLEVLNYLYEFVDVGILDIDAQDKTGNTALHIAVERKQLRGLDWLINHGANTKIKNSSNQAPIHYAVELGYLDGVKVREICLIDGCKCSLYFIVIEICRRRTSHGKFCWRHGFYSLTLRL